MKTKILFTGLLAMFVYGGIIFTHNGYVGAEENVGNKICPVSGESVEGMGGAVSYEYKGKLYNMCCKMCSKDFEKDPEKFAKIAEANAAEKAAKKGCCPG
jgi:YHS domain-containing protein